MNVYVFKNDGTEEFTIEAETKAQALEEMLHRLGWFIDEEMPA